MEIKLNDICSKNFTNINVTFAEKTITSLIGMCESKKTELINVICGLQKVTNGTIQYGRKKICSNSNNKKIEVIKRDVYYLKEDYKSMLFNINIKEDIKFYLGEYNKEKLFEMFNSFNLDNAILENNYLELSSSQVKKLLLIIGLMSTTKIIVLENPTLALDNKAIQTLIKHLKKLKRENKIIIISSYNSNFLLEISDKIVVIDDNKIIEEGNKFEILSNEDLLNKINLNIPNVLSFINKVKELKNIKLGYRDNINDLIKDIFRYAK